MVRYMQIKRLFFVRVFIDSKSKLCKNPVLEPSTVQYLRGAFQMDEKICETLNNNEYIEIIHQMSYSSFSDNGMLQIFIFLIK